MHSLKNAKARFVANDILHRRSSSAVIDSDGDHFPLLGDEAQPRHQKASRILLTSIYASTKVILTSNYVNALLVFVPLGILAGAFHCNPIAVFALNFLAIIPLASLLSFATEELATKVGQTLGGLLNASFGNAVELIISIVALARGEIRIVQTSMLGSILSNLLLVLGMCFFIGGIKYPEQQFNMTVAQAMNSLLAVATSSLFIPAAYVASVPKELDTERQILILSRGTSIILLLVYVCYLVFQLKTHTALYEPQEEVEQQESSISPWVAANLLALVTVVVAVCAEYLVGSIDALVTRSGMSKTFVGLILIPIVGNAAEHVTAIVVSIHNKMDLAVGVAIGSSMQIALFMTPFLVVLGWILGQPMSLYFQTFETAIMFISVFIVGTLIQDGKSNYLEGILLMSMYAIIAVAFYLYPDNVSL
ncbi:Vacuolar calcium ion transporter [Neolecta irregularis DAH-3]|uniref:Vacuolar calcium ion transporter n=1 Tax=Neolecta irregularis (strain DAH-3) TaxID=1198029 RepID=A0A1U7LP38_NEOID|nr:Vacuolar calcium ion transporter [Neolecta irregularis DAH-3]|eukprot:OLL24417.1 Vacuolar calcium ion transporter [Neolecta irregularis DAH-3]